MRLPSHIKCQEKLPGKTSESPYDMFPFHGRARPPIERRCAPSLSVPLVMVGEGDLSQREDGRGTVLRRELDLDGRFVGLALSGFFLSLSLLAEPLLLLVLGRLSSQPLLWCARWFAQRMQKVLVRRRAYSR